MVRLEAWPQAVPQQNVAFIVSVPLGSLMMESVIVAGGFVTVGSKICPVAVKIIGSAGELWSISKIYTYTIPFFNYNTVFVVPACGFRFGGGFGGQLATFN